MAALAHNKRETRIIARVLEWVHHACFTVMGGSLVTPSGITLVSPAAEKDKGWREALLPLVPPGATWRQYQPLFNAQVEGFLRTQANSIREFKERSRLIREGLALLKTANDQMLDPYVADLPARVPLPSESLQEYLQLTRLEQGGIEQAIKVDDDDDDEEDSDEEKGAVVVEEDEDEEDD